MFFLPFSSVVITTLPVCKYDKMLLTIHKCGIKLMPVNKDIACNKSLKIPKGGNQDSYIIEGQTTQWLKEKGQQDKQRSTKQTHKTKYRATRIPLKQVMNSVASEG